MASTLSTKPCAASRRPVASRPSIHAMRASSSSLVSPGPGASPAAGVGGTATRALMGIRPHATSRTSSSRGSLSVSCHSHVARVARVRRLRFLGLQVRVQGESVRDRGRIVEPEMLVARGGRQLLLHEPGLLTSGPEPQAPPGVHAIVRVARPALGLRGTGSSTARCTCQQATKSDIRPAAEDTPRRNRTRVAAAPSPRAFASGTCASPSREGRRNVTEVGLFRTREISGPCPAAGAETLARLVDRFDNDSIGQPACDVLVLPLQEPVVPRQANRLAATLPRQLRARGLHAQSGPSIRPHPTASGIASGSTESSSFRTGATSATRSSTPI